MVKWGPLFIVLLLLTSLSISIDARAAHSVSRFTPVLGGAAYLDNETGLTWEQTPLSKTVPYTPSAYTDAEANCYGAVTGGKHGWRLPTANELSSLLDVSLRLPAGNPFSGVANEDRFWTSSPVQSSSPLSIYSITIGDLFEQDSPPTLSNFWCVMKW